jgi:hypothetical protein
MKTEMDSNTAHAPIRLAGGEFWIGGSLPIGTGPIGNPR